MQLQGLSPEQQLAMDTRIREEKGTPYTVLRAKNTKRPHNWVDLSGRIFGNLKVIRFDKVVNTNSYWIAECSCGNVVSIRGGHLTKSKVKSCRCRSGNYKHYLAINGHRTPEYQMWMGAKKRAREKGLVFSISPFDIVIPKNCPLLNLVLRRGKGILKDCSPSLDRLDNEKGYTKENIWVISHKANRIKGALSLGQLKDFVENLEKEIIDRRISVER